MVMCERDVSVHEFTAAMLTESEGSFGRRIRSFEDRFGPADEATLALLGEAAYFCWFGVEYEKNFFAVCRAIGEGKPLPFRICLQITPERWMELNTYVVGVQRWLGVDRPIPEAVDREKIDRIAGWLGERSSVKEMLAILFLSQLVDHILFRVSFAKMSSGGDLPRKAEFVDFSPWYVRPDGLTYTTGYDYESNLMGQGADGYVTEQRVGLFRSAELAPQDAGELVMQILKPTPPPCMHRFTRYQDIKLASIGALKWRGNLQPDNGKKEEWQEFCDEAGTAMRLWMDRRPTKTDVGQRIYEALGEPTAKNVTIVREFLLQEPPGTTYYCWLKERAEKDGTTPDAVFG